ncbi:MAG TPA: beta-propeller fold lactonase family protein [Terriglobia bacterium]|nr:beta-propeller fold lactonase family protein [Terriglobia bacterium]
MREGRDKVRPAILAGVFVIAIGIFYSYRPPAAPEPATGAAQLVSIQELPELSEMCVWEPGGANSNGNGASHENNVFAAFQETSAYAASQEAGQTGEVTRPPLRNIRDTDPIYTAVTVDTRLDEVLLQDTNTWSIRVFNRLDNTAASAQRTEAKRVIGGEKTDVQFNSCVYVDPKNGDIYSVENDIGDSIVVFSHDANGDATPIRKLKVTHRAYSMAVDEESQELYLSVQYPPQVAVYRKMASGDEKPLRLIQGESTRLSDVHGLAIDAKNKLLFVNNWGNISDYSVPGTGRFEAPSITIYSLDANGDTAPLRIIQGSKTQLNWPGAMSLDPETGNLYVANDVNSSIIVFRETDKGDVAPARVIKGNKTGLSYPTGVFVDSKNKELWASNLGNSSVTVYPLTANGNVAPVRTIRSAPLGKASLKFGKTQAVAYDSKREEILVPN